MKLIAGFLFFTVCVLSGVAGSADRADLEGTSIFGSSELPKVLYIVPWKKPEVGDLVGRPVTSLLDEALAPVDREVFQRQVEFHDALQKKVTYLP
ncbi:MAG: hypothetical protein HY081_04950 [Gammaproteobacteria bacterium]|nr:hypothetical protein [Gammaproteobacteria bacterium]